MLLPVLQSQDHAIVRSFLALASLLRFFLLLRFIIGVVLQHGEGILILISLNIHRVIGLIMMCNGLLLRMVRVIITLRHMPAIVLRMSMCLFGWLMSLRVAMRRLLDLFEFWWVGLLLVTVEHIQLFCVLLDIHAIRGLDFVMLVVVCVWLLNLFCLNWRSEIYAFPSLFKLLFYVTRLGNGRHFYFNITILGRLDSLFNLHSLDYSRLLVIIRAGGLRFIYGLNF